MELCLWKNIYLKNDMKNTSKIIVAEKWDCS